MDNSFLSYGRKYSQLRRLMRNEIPLSPLYNMPIIKKNTVDISNLKLTSYDNRMRKKSQRHLHTIHFFIEDNLQERVYLYPRESLKLLAKYAHVLTPDYSLYVDMPLPIQMFNVFKSRWCGATWQDLGISVIPTVSWSNEKSYSFCFEGIETGSSVAISTVGVDKRYRSIERELFIRGFREMIQRISPHQILWYGPKIIDIDDDRIFYYRYNRYEQIQSREKNNEIELQYSLELVIGSETQDMEAKYGRQR